MANTKYNITNVTIENPSVRGLGVSGGIRTHMPFDTSPSSWSVCHFATDTDWRCRCDSNACAGFHRPGSLANCSRNRLGTAPYDGVPRFVHRDIRYRPAAPKQAAATIKAAFCVVRPKGFEPPTHGLKVRCSSNWATSAYLQNKSVHTVVMRHGRCNCTFARIVLSLQLNWHFAWRYHAKCHC